MNELEDYTEETGSELDDVSPTEGSSGESSTGMMQTESAVKFINSQVLQPDVTPIQGTAKTMADQAAAMMIEDVRSFLQGNEQVLTVALARASALLLEEKTLPVGIAAIENLNILMGDLAKFAGTIGKTATTIVSEFNGDA